MSLETGLGGTHHHSPEYAVPPTLSETLQIQGTGPVLSALVLSGLVISAFVMSSLVSSYLVTGRVEPWQQAKLLSLETPDHCHNT